MTLDDVFYYLSTGELSQLFIGTGESGEIPYDSRPNVAASVWLGLTELHKRFLIKEKRIKIEIQEGLTSYRIHSDYAKSNTDSLLPNKYLDDLDDPFKDDINNIENILDENGCDIPLNVVDNIHSIHLTSFNSIVIPKEFTSKTIEVVYRANHTALNDADVQSKPFDVEIELPPTYIEPLLFYVASRVHTPVGLNQEFNGGNTYAARFEAACQRIENLNHRVDRVSEETLFEQNGWV